MNSLVIFILILFVLNVLIFFLAKISWLVWGIAGVIFIVSTPFVISITTNVIGQKVGDGIAGAAAGFTFSALLVINAIVFFIVAFFTKRNKDKKILNNQ
ncbi:hypothetical protein KFZ58_03820 [Virgibacillus sp. NKC19-16]|uniref:hypothetical protein n=1 Tax=Virgibacillus salidurans TaxID=2831673 RepID=UPI001F2B647F|nr:hypothetical protein [Virgibacillus sp. NKC19-16]UJL47074.1 hypothetical protein KFZ58_03820 [Virgibacillus sp. NKC19-16]